MDDVSGHNTINNTPSMEITGQIMVVAIIILFVVVVFVLFLHLYAKWFWWRVEQPPARSSRRQRRRFVFTPGQDPAFALRTGLDPAVLRSIPVVTFTPLEFKDGLECAVCLSELDEGEKARLLPKCNHGFHVDCIDMWFQSHSTCPLCRNPVDLESPLEIEVQSSEENLAPGYSAESPNFPTNVLFWGNETQVSTGGVSLEEGTSSSSSSSSSIESSPPCASSSSSTLSSSRRGEMLVIDIPVRMSEHLSSLSPAISPEEESKSPVTTRLRSLKRLLSREKKLSPSCTSSSSSTSFDIEQIRKG